MKVDVFSDCTLSVGVSNPDPSNNLATHLEDVWKEHGCVEKMNLVAREVNLIWNILPSGSTLDIKKHVQRYLGEQNPESFEHRIIFMSMFTRNGQKKAIHKLVCTNAKQVAATKFKPRHRCYLERASENTWWNASHNEPQ